MYFALENKSFAFTCTRGKHLSYTPHMHTHLEMVLIEKSGSSRATADDKTVVLETNDLFVTFPNQIHYYEDLSPINSVFILIISPDMCPEFKEVFKNYIPQSPVFKNAGKNPLIKIAFKTLCECDETRDKYSEILARGSLLIIMSEFLKNTSLEKISSHNTDLLKEILHYCYENYTSEISLESISNALHINKSHISRLFNKRLNVGFINYINSLRIRKACEMLKSNNFSITEIAFSVGYNSVRSFNRCFREIRGTSPKQYQIHAFEKKLQKY